MTMITSTSHGVYQLKEKQAAKAALKKLKDQGLDDKEIEDRGLAADPSKFIAPDSDSDEDLLQRRRRRRYKKKM